MAADSLFSAPKQQRSRETLDRVLEAATDLLQDVGYDAMRIAEVSERANVGTASIYARVGSKHGLMLAVQARMVEQLDREAEDLLSPLFEREIPFEQLVFATVRVVGELFRRHEALLRVFMIRGDVDSTVIEHGSASSIRLSELFAKVLLQRRSEISHPDPPRAIDVSFRLVYDTLARRVARGAAFESQRELPWNALVDELAVVCAAYLLHARGVEAR